MIKGDLSQHDGYVRSEFLNLMTLAVETTNANIQSNTLPLSSPY